MKKLLLTIAAIAVASTSTVSAQLGVFNHLGVDLSVSTTGIGLEVSTPITDWVQLRAGASMIPDISFNASFDGTAEVNTPAGLKKENFDVDITGKVGRTQGDVIFNIYPFGRLNSLFVAGGLYFGGKSIIKLDGHSDKVADLQNQGILSQGYIEVGDYKLDFEKNGNIYGALVTKNVRPYLGLGYGRPCPGSRLGFMVELGVQFMGKMKVCQGKNLEPIDLSNLGNDDDWQKWMDKLTVYPVFKLTLAGKIF